MNKMDLKKYGITGVTEIVYNPSYLSLIHISEPTRPY